jgi:dienelactone hydrolase
MKTALGDRGPRLLALAALAGTLAAGCTASAPSTHIHLQVSERVSLYDVPLDIRVSGLHPGDKVTLRLESRDRRWSARATFDAPQPVIDLDKAGAVSGSYRGLDGMGIFEALAPRSQEGTAFAPGNPAAFTLTASAQDGSTATVTITRDLTGPGVACAQLRVSGPGFYGLYCAPAPHAGRRPPVLVFGGSEGGLSTAPTAELLASRGYPALALAYFGEPGLPGALDRIALEYFARAARWLSRQPGADARGLTVWGDSRGSEAALLLGAYFPGLVRAVIGGSPSSVANPAVSLTHPVPHADPAWTLHGKPLPTASPYGDPSSSGNPAAVIPVQRIMGPILLLVGADDQLWPSPLYAQAIMTRLRQAHDRYPHQDLVFNGAGHLAGAAFPYGAATVSFTTPLGTLQLGGTPFANSVAETKAWQDVLAFLRRLS